MFDKSRSQDLHGVRKLNLKMSGKTALQCKYRGKFHAVNENKCPTYGKKCNRGQKAIHFAILCNTSLSKPAKKGGS